MFQTIDAVELSRLIASGEAPRVVDVEEMFVPGVGG